MKTKEHAFPGKVEASRQANLSFRVPGEIKQYHVKSGQQVKAGQLLAELIPTDYQAIEYAKKASFELAKVQHERSKALVKDFLISQDKFDSTKTQLLVSQNELDNATTNLKYTKLYAPYDGIIAATYLNDHEYAQALQPIMSLQSEDAIDVVMAVPERLIGAIRRSHLKENKPNVTFAVAPEKTYTLTFKEVETTADRESGAFNVTLTMPRPDDLKLYPGMAATVNAQLVLDSNVMIQKIPASATWQEQGKHWVWVVNDNQVLDKVSIELSSQGELITGLADGDQIVASGVTELKAGQKVKQWVKERGL
ncbi:efflux RND transporter periplasmic adaptor subunit [Catenovulum sp. SM1970]|uniref:efflux RND transporter periplasmic adaptor subunit n=1 Tax=Marinifaba aquimaris TaxID=2741323 RepID=UPI00157411EF|nr:efflux RND transporter periplasmic adaptor subunit [Marinifaba aquimaris]NTS77241.1 efflux RND transporter periplasmic adaptor subunit [Marinifaba aquimaris]